MSPRKDGGNAVPLEGSGAAPVQVPKSTCIAVPIKDQKRAKFFKAANMQEFTSEVAKKFKVSLKTQNGAQTVETIAINQLEDAELDAITMNSKVLKQQQLEKDFLYNFIEEWKHNPSFRERFVELLNDDTRRTDTLRALKEVRNAMKQEDTLTMIENFLKQL